MACLLMTAGSRCFIRAVEAQEKASTAREADAKEITAMLQAWEEAWNRHDMRAFASLFHADGVRVLWTGKIWSGPQTIEAGHAEVHRTIFRKSIQRERLEELTFVGADDAVWKIGWGQNTRFADNTPDAPACSTQQ